MSSAQAFDLLQEAMKAGTEKEKNALLNQVGSALQASVNEAVGSPKFTFKYQDAGTNPMSGTEVVQWNYDS